MTRWQRGEAAIERLISDGDLQRITGAQAAGDRWLDKAERMLESARELADQDPESAYILAYDAARRACTGLLIQQGLRPTTSGGHYVVERAVRAQFGEHLGAFATMRRRRNELEYPTDPADEATPEEAREAVETARRILDGAGKLVTTLEFFT